MRRFVIIIGLFITCTHITQAQNSDFNMKSALNKCMEAANRHDFQTCINTGLNAIHTIDSIDIKTDSSLFDLYYFVCASYYAQNELRDALPYGLKAVELYDIYALSSRVDIFVQILYILSDCYEYIGDYEKLQNLRMNLISFMEKHNLLCTHYYLQALAEMATYYDQRGDVSGLREVCSKAYNCIMKPEFKITLRNISSVSIVAEKMYSIDNGQAMSVDNRILDFSDDLQRMLPQIDVNRYNLDRSFFVALGTSIKSYYRVGRREDGAEYILSVLNILDRIIPILEDVSLLNMITITYSHCFQSIFSNHKESSLIMAQPILKSMDLVYKKMRDNSRGTSQYTYDVYRAHYQRMNCYSKYHKAIYNYSKALNFDTLATISARWLYGEKSEQLGYNYYCIAETYGHLGNHKESARYAKMAADILEQYGEKNVLLMLAQLKIVEETLAEMDKKAFLAQLDKISNKLSQLDLAITDEYDLAVMRTAEQYVNCGQYQSAAKWFKLINNKYQNEHVLLGLVRCCSMSGQYDEAEILMDSLFALKKRSILNQLRYTPEKLRTNLWNRNAPFFQKEIPAMAYRINTDAANMIATDAVLISKGLLLNTDIEYSNLVYNALLGDSLFQESREQEFAYKHLSEIATVLGSPEAEAAAIGIHILNQQFGDTSNNAYINGVNINANEDLKIGLLREQQRQSFMLAKYGNFTQDLFISWVDIQKRLSSKDAAIEFCAVAIDGDSTAYLAYVIRPNWTSPKQVVLSILAKGDSLSKQGEIYQDQQLSKKIWGTLSPVLNGVENVFFSPSGELNYIAIESLPDYDTPSRIISKRYNLFRLSSTRVLAKKKGNKPITNSRVYGGLTYNVASEVIIRDEASRSSAPKYVLMGDATVDTTFRNNKPLSPLIGSKLEALQIDSIMRIGKIPNKLYTDTMGTESSFKHISGEETSMILISTHGYYDSTRHNFHNIGFNCDSSMLWSGLYMTGADIIRTGGALPHLINDGILTAEEISRMDLRGTDLVVLSACQTGLGELKGDGVFGLQRGFKKAGVNSIVMSLWSVDDIATLILMTHFYENLVLKKMPKKQALDSAQASVRDFEIPESEWDWVTNMPKNLELFQKYISNYCLITESDWKELKEIRKKRGSTTEKWTPIARRVRENNNSTKIHPFEKPDYWAAFILLDGVD